MEWAKLRMSKSWKSQKLSLDYHPETSRGGAGPLTQHLDRLSMLMTHLSSLNLQPMTLSYPGYSHTLPLKLHNPE